MIGLVMLGVELGEGSANNWLTLGVRDGHGRSDAVAAAYFTVFAIGETVARVGGGPLVDRIGRVMTIRVTTALGVIGLLGFILGGPAPVVLVGVVLWAIGVSMGFPLGMSAAADSGPDPAARVSVVASIGYIANLGGPPVVGALSEHVGLLNALFVIIALLLVGFFCAGSLRRPA
ncbi:sugar MFS transporter [Microlunatus sp. Gsoil 973]|uniref:MFS transporter n=1 Tax=Microlunatus sp. Gsoil 973 TaxID=2672569 RepID=UPI0012B4E63F|nr:MFS transporter [Microlunatus sp. Gsoil 973]QGN31785.1 MFS transporter [Microlunatus sp. Gsoil 973]